MMMLNRQPSRIGRVYFQLAIAFSTVLVAPWGGQGVLAQESPAQAVPTQVEMWVKIIEFQATKGVET